jgi:hypothetical protein
MTFQKPLFCIQVGSKYLNPSIHFTFSQPSHKSQYWKTENTGLKKLYQINIFHIKGNSWWQGDCWQNHLSAELVLPAISSRSTVSPLGYHNLMQHRKDLIIYRHNDDHSSVTQPSPKLLCISYIPLAMWLCNIILVYRSYSHMPKMMGPEFKTITLKFSPTYIKIHAQ